MAESEKDRLAQYLRVLRKRAGLGQKELVGLLNQHLAEEDQVTPQAVSNWERGRNLPSRRSIRAIEKVYKRAPGEIDDLLDPYSIDFTGPITSATIDKLNAGEYREAGPVTRAEFDRLLAESQRLRAELAAVAKRLDENTAALTEAMARGIEGSEGHALVSLKPAGQDDAEDAPASQ